jgi:DNA polymerase
MPSAADFLPASTSLASLRAAAAQCRGCDLYKHATQTVFGEGPARARLMFVGEQPGDSEDLQGKPFVGPAGKLLRGAMEDAGLDPSDAYVTNAVKHFKFVVRGKRRIHSKPKSIEINACRPWLQAELQRVNPDVVVALGATAAQTLLGTSFRVTQHRQELLSCELAPRVVATVHPSSILRAPDEAARHRELAAFVDDLRFVASLRNGGASGR